MHSNAQIILKVFVLINCTKENHWPKFEVISLINEWVMRQTNVCLNRVFKFYVNFT